jgi:hypothetical protein
MGRRFSLYLSPRWDQQPALLAKFRRILRHDTCVQVSSFQQWPTVTVLSSDYSGLLGICFQSALTLRWEENKLN